MEEPQREDVQHAMTRFCQVRLIVSFGSERVNLETMVRCLEQRTREAFLFS